MALEMVLYDNGNQNIEVTGGWIKGIDTQKKGTVDPAYNGNRLRIRVYQATNDGRLYGVSATTQNIIDFTNIKKIILDIPKVYNSGGNAFTYLYISPSQTNSNGSVKTEKLADRYEVNNMIKEIDVSDITGKYYLHIYGQTYTAATDDNMVNISVAKVIAVLKNTPPTISGTPASGSNLGTKTAGFNVTYTVNDAEGDTVTVKEYLDDVLQRSYAATRGETNTIQCVTAANFQTVLNGAHTLKVVANDGKVDSDAYTVTFTKKVTKATITLTTPLTANAAIQVMVMAITGYLPADAKLTVLVTNNAKDSSPVWEDATADVKRGSNYIFTNKTAANGNAYNFKITVERGDSDVGGNISGIGGAFE